MKTAEQVVANTKSAAALVAALADFATLHPLPNLLPINRRAHEKVAGAILIAQSFGKRRHRRGWASL